MQKLFISVFMMLALTMPHTVFATSDEDAAEVTEETTEATENTVAEEDAVAEEEELQSGIGWQLIRTLEMGKSGKFVNMILVEQDRYMDKTIYSTAITRLCQNEEEFCRVRFWSQARWVPEKVSMSPAQYQQLKADYLFNKTAGIQQLRWSCSVDANSENCME
ncbi:MAG: hypothetical protein K0U40_05685 [Betaproteobacteria bacterium]|nr:hypothetical protein [Betaproteobacteria bacterium]